MSARLLFPSDNRIRRSVRGNGEDESTSTSKLYPRRRCARQSLSALLSLSLGRRQKSFAYAISERYSYVSYV